MPRSLRAATSRRGLFRHIPTASEIIRSYVSSGFKSIEIPPLARVDADPE
jgi:hypothetical protein